MAKEVPRSSLEYIIKALVPYTEANMKLVFKPHLFFKDLEKISNRKQKTLHNAYYQAVKNGLIELDEFNVPRLTERGKRKTVVYKPQKLKKGAKLVVIFDIPEEERWKRRHLRLLLKELSFQQIQKSVWASEFDHRDYLQAEIKQYKLENYVIVYEAIPIIGVTK